MDVPRIAPDSPVHPTTPYGASKLAANQLSFMLCKELGMEWIWPRIFSVYGIYEKETTMIASGLRKMLKGEKTEFTPAEQRWDYLYSKDAGRAYYLIGEKGRDGAVTVWEAGRHILCGNISCRWRNLPERIHRESARDHIRREQCGICVQI